MLLSAATKVSLTEVLGLVQKTVLNAASELEDEAHSQVARMSAEVAEARRERDEALGALRAAEVSAEIVASKHAHELAQMRAANDNLSREVTHWKDQAKNWQDHYTRVEQDRCGLSTELLTLSRSALTESPPKSHSAKHASRPPAYKSAMPPSPTESDSPPSQSVSMNTHRNPRTPASKPATMVSAVASTSKSAKSKHASSSQFQTPAQPVRQILLRRVQAVVHVKEEEDDDDQIQADEEDNSVRLVQRRGGSGFVVLDNDEASDSEQQASEEGLPLREDDSGDELMMDPRQEIYGGVHPVLTPDSTIRVKRPGTNKPEQTDGTPTKRRRVSDSGVAVRARVPAKRK